jgi:signal transduction histidine kinase/DNA-binding response OmpR family regulator
MSSFKNSRGELFFGGLNGLNVFHPDSIKDNAVIPDVHITSFEIFNNPVSVHQPQSPLKKAIDKTDEITLSYEQSVFSFEFASLNYTSPDKNQYAYKMEGFDKDWIYTNNNKAIYTNLNHGEYTFRVKASNNDGIWNERGTAVKIIITPPFWKTWTFKIIVALSLLGIVYSFFRIRVSVINKQKVALEKEVKRQTAEVIQQKEALEVEREEAEKARQDAEQANQAKSIFLATMSHEIRTPMNGVLGMASLLAETNQTKEQQEYTDTIRNSGQALLTIINDILDFSKIDSGNLELENHGFDLRQCIEEVMDVFAAKASENGIDLLYQIDYNIPHHIVGDKYRLRQILINLISNAMKFTSRGEIFVGVDLVHVDGDRLEIAFHVRDTGIGIPEDKLSRLFKAFSQVDSATNRKYGGTGLGLVISQRLVELMGGKISVVSQPEVGSTFSFSIQSQIAKSENVDHTEARVVGYEGKRVLLVDESITNLNVLKTQLEQWHLKTALAFSGPQALEILGQDSAYDLVIVDMQMPNMDGLQLSMLIKMKLSHLPIIMISSIGDESKKKFPDLFSAVLSKPVKQQQLARDVQAALRIERIVINPKEEKPKYVLSADFAEKFPLSILLAEDNPINQKLATRILNKLGYKDIAVAQNGAEAVQKLNAKFYEVILMDMQMPEMDGLEATRQIRLHAQQQPIIIAMTANAMQADRDQCMQAGMNDFVTKPIKLEALMGALEKASEASRLVTGPSVNKSNL